MTNFVKQIKKAKRIALFSHISPDPDTIGSTLAFRRILVSLGKDVDVFCTDDIPEDYNFYDDFKLYAGEPSGQYDLLIAVDVASAYRLGKYEEMFMAHENTLKIDHHQESDDFAKVNYVKILSATAVIIFDLSKKLRAKIDKTTASLLYMALCGDTGVFRYTNTDSKTFEVAAALASHGAEIRKVYSEFFDKKKKNGVMFNSHLLLGAEFYDKYGFALMTATAEDYKKFKIDPAKDNISNLPHTLLSCGYKIAGVIKEKPDGIHVSLRSKFEYDVSKIGAKFGGGGHKNAAGFYVDLPLADAKKALEKEIKKYLKENEDVKWYWNSIKRKTFKR